MLTSLCNLTVHCLVNSRRTGVEGLLKLNLQTSLHAFTRIIQRFFFVWLRRIIFSADGMRRHIGIKFDQEQWRVTLLRVTVLALEEICPKLDLNYGSWSLFEAYEVYFKYNVFYTADHRYYLALNRFDREIFSMVFKYLQKNRQCDFIRVKGWFSIFSCIFNFVSRLMVIYRYLVILWNSRRQHFLKNGVIALTKLSHALNLFVLDFLKSLWCRIWEQSNLTADESAFWIIDQKDCVLIGKELICIRWFADDLSLNNSTIQSRLYVILGIWINELIRRSYHS